MLLDGCILEVLESYPVQLTVVGELSRYHVELSEETIVLDALGKAVPQGQLRPGTMVKVYGDTAAASSAVVAVKIEIALDCTLDGSQ